MSNPPTQAQLQALNTQVTAFYANTRFIYDEQGRLLGEYSKDGKLVEETVWFDDLPVAVLKPKGASATSPVSGTGNVATNNQDANNTGTNGNTAPPAAPTAKVNVEVFYVHPDHLGTPRVITASTALAATTGTGITSPQTVNKAVWRWDSDPFGSNATANSAPNENPNTLSQVVGTATLPYLFGFDLAFPGQKRDRETGKHYNYFRDYDPSVGRYFESDPIGLIAGPNTFAYVENKPLRWTDQRGLAIPPILFALLSGCARGCLTNAAFEFGKCCQTTCGILNMSADCANKCKPDLCKFYGQCWTGCVGGILGGAAGYYFGGGKWYEYAGPGLTGSGLAQVYKALFGATGCPYGLESPTL